MQQSGQQGLQNEGRAAAGADGKGVVSAYDFPGVEHEFHRSEFRTIDARFADFCGGFHAGEMLAHQAWLGPLATDVCHPKGTPGDEGQGERRAQELAAAGFAGDLEDGGGFGH